MCLYPKLIKNPKYKVNKKNGGNVPPVYDNRVLYVPIGCQKCIECRKQKARNWQVRLSEEIKKDKSGKFIAITFDSESLKKLSEELTDAEGYTLDNAIATLAMRRFLERWRKKYKISVKHWFITELGQTNTERIHMHGILFTNISNEIISEIWKYGIISVGKRKYYNGKQLDDNPTGYVNGATINYIIKYVLKGDKVHQEYEAKILTSAGIGSKYMETENAKTNTYKGDKTNETYKTKQGTQLALPKYYRNKIYNDDEREALWIHKLDKGERYVLGQKIIIKNDEDEKQYFKMLELAREKNNRLGYGDDSINWERKRYENQLRRLKRNEQYKSKNPNAQNCG